MSQKEKLGRFIIPTGNAQLVYGIKGKAGETFEVNREGTMLPIGKYKVIEKAINEFSIVGKSFSDIEIQKEG